LRRLGGDSLPDQRGAAPQNHPDGTRRAAVHVPGFAATVVRRHARPETALRAHFIHVLPVENLQGGHRLRTKIARARGLYYPSLCRHGPHGHDAELGAGNLMAADADANERLLETTTGRGLM